MSRTLTNIRGTLTDQLSLNHQRFLADTIARNKARFGGFKMEDEPVPSTPPEGVSEEEWNALGDPGKKAIVRERKAREDAERRLAARPPAPAPQPPAPAPGPPAPQPPAPAPSATPGQPGGQDLAKLISDAVAAAVAPFEQREQQRAAATAAQQVQDAVVTAARTHLHDPTDALANIDLTKVVGEDGAADTEKIGVELDELLKRKPHLAKDTRRIAAPGVGPTVGGAQTPMKEQVQSVLADMQRSTGVRLPSNTP